MPKGQLLINGQDAYLKWGVFLGDTAVSTLMTPAPNKDYVSNSSRLSDGKTVDVSNSKKMERDITLIFHMRADTEEKFLANYEDFCENVLAKGEIVIHTSFLPKVWYKCTYVSCTQFSEFFRELASFSLKLNEPNPADRGKPL